MDRRCFACDEEIPANGGSEHEGDTYCDYCWGFLHARAEAGIEINALDLMEELPVARFPGNKWDLIRTLMGDLDAQ